MGKLLRYFVDIPKSRVLELSLQEKFWLAVIVGPVIEEAFYRGIPLYFTNTVLSWQFLVSIIVFTITHKSNYYYNFIFISPVFVIMGFGLSCIAIKWGLFYAILAHSAINLVALFVNKDKKNRLI